MRLPLLFFWAIVLVCGCSSSKKITKPLVSYPLYVKGVNPVSSGDLPVSATANLGVAKLYKGNSGTGSGIFISGEGLFLTNYSAIIDFIASGDDPDFFSKGFIAASGEDEIPLQGISLLIEIEQKDVTEEVQKEITELSLNYEIYRSVQQQKNRLIEQRRGSRNDLIVQIKDLYSGNRHIMTVYQIIPDIRLVFAPSVPLRASELSKSGVVQSAIKDEYVILRAYSQENLSAFNPGFHFSLANQLPEVDEELISFGFPGQTYRLETSRAINFYHTKLNPYITYYYDIYLDKEDSLASLSDIYGLRSLSNRYLVRQNLTFFETVQKSISEQEVISQKKEQEALLIEETKSDTALASFYPNLFSSINRAYDIAEQTADIQYAASYFSTFSNLDDLANIFRQYLSEENPSPELLQRAMDVQKQLLSKINIGGELQILKQSLPVFKSIPEDQQPLILFDLFAEADNNSIHILSARYVDEVLASSFLLNPEYTREVLESGTLNQDELFNLLEEIAFSFETGQQNFLRHYAYLFPAQQVLTRAKMERSSSEMIPPDSDSFLSFNKGSIHPKTSEESPYFYTTNDFSGKAPGTAIVTTEGTLAGMVTEDVNYSIPGNYIYSKESSFLKAIRISSLLEEIEAFDGSDSLLQELLPRD